MTLIIDIPENEYIGIKSFPNANTSYPWTIHLYDAVKNGIPLEDIKAEIINIPITDTDGHSNNWYREPQAIIDDVIEIIDMYIGKGEV